MQFVRELPHRDLVVVGAVAVRAQPAWRPGCRRRTAAAGRTNLASAGDIANAACALPRRRNMAATPAAADICTNSRLVGFMPALLEVRPASRRVPPQSRSRVVLARPGLGCQPLALAASEFLVVNRQRKVVSPGCVATAPPSTRATPPRHRTSTPAWAPSTRGSVRTNSTRSRTRDPRVDAPEQHARAAGIHGQARMPAGVTNRPEANGRLQREARRARLHRVRHRHRLASSAAPATRGAGPRRHSGLRRYCLPSRGAGAIGRKYCVGRVRKYWVRVSQAGASPPASRWWTA